MTKKSISNEYALLAVIFLVSCKNKKAESRGNIDIVNPQVEQIVQTFIDSYFRNARDTTIMMGFHWINDTVELYIVDSYPDISLEGFKGYKTFDSTRVCFAADSLFSDYFKVREMIPIPEDIVMFNKEYKSHGFYEPTEWNFWSTDANVFHR